MSTRKVDDLVAALGIATGVSKSQVSRICTELDQAVSEFKERRLDHIEFPYLFLDATYGKAHEGPLRDAVLVAYEYCCAMCGYDGPLGTEAIGLDAAHVRWWAFDGPATVDNALCLCSFHHKLLDRGVVGIGDDHTVDVSARFVGRGRAAEVFVLDLLGKPPRPQRGQAFPALDHVQWHRGQVFSGPARVPV